MNYQSPIELIQTQMEGRLIGTIYEAVMNVGVNVDKEELLKALQYDREQYQKGYKDRDDQLVRCKDCKHFEIKDWWGDFNGVPILASSDCPTCNKWGDGCMTKPDGYCFMAERKD